MLMYSLRIITIYTLWHLYSIVMGIILSIMGYFLSTAQNHS